MSSFPALPGFYNFFFLYLEPLSTIGPAVLCLTQQTASFYNDLVPSGFLAPTTTDMNPRTITALWQLANTYFLIGLSASLVFRAIRDALPDNLVAQERILGASLTALAIVDITHIFVTLAALPADIRFDFAEWNTMIHGNVSFVVVLLLVRVAWFAGVGRTRYYFGQPQQTGLKKKKE